jgi:2-polyprenyl-6-methoxyphenol hydroxylase-like FAD-dependent oxidoreductase
LTDGRPDAVVLGGGLAGLLTALALAQAGLAVEILERDASPDAQTAEEAFRTWVRPGVPQFRMQHGWRSPMWALLEQRLPDVASELIEAGAEARSLLDELFPGETTEADRQLVQLHCRRPVLEWVLRRAAVRDPRIRLREGSPVVSWDAAQTREGQVRVMGVRTATRSIEAPLFIDCMGRRSPTPKWIEDTIGVRPPQDLNDCNLVYYCRFYRAKDEFILPRPTSVSGSIAGNTGYLVYAVVPSDSRTFGILLSIPPWDRDLKIIREADVFHTVAANFAPLREWLAMGDPISSVHAMGGLQNRIREFRTDGHPFCDNMAHIGDSICHTNPTLGLGGTVAAEDAFAFADVLAGAADPNSAIEYHLVGRQSRLRDIFKSSSELDELRTAEWHGLDTSNEKFTNVRYLQKTLMPAGVRDLAVGRALLRRLNLIDPLDAIWESNDIRARAEAAVRSDPPRPSAAPSRENVLSDAGLVPRGTASA